ncbi:MAG: flavodoxin family protein [Lachnospiraceae bacterium]|nr:flavodoxin family protein [Lachnospiraceae bacterium]
MKKVLGIATGRRNGNSEILLKVALKACEEAGCEVSFLRLHDYNVKPCTGCELCTKLMVKKRLNGGEGEVHCMYPWDADDFMDIVEQVVAADGIILAAPAYHLMPPGIETVLLNRIHCVGLGNGSKHGHEERRVCASIGVGGSDWTSLFMPIMNFTGSELLGSQMHLVDQMKLHRTPAIGMVLCNQEAMDRAAQLGKNVAFELHKTEGPIEYHGEEGVCPVCHNDLVVIRNGRCACAICDYEGDPVIEDGKIKGIKWDGGIEITRWSPHGVEHHDAEQLATVKLTKMGYEFTEEQQKMMDEGRKVWGAYLDPVMPKRNK